MWTIKGISNELRAMRMRSGHSGRGRLVHRFGLPTPRLVGCVWLIFCASLTVGCAQNMRDQSRIKPYEQSEFFPDGESARPLVPGTVARGELRTDEHFYTGTTGGATTGDTEDSGDQGGGGGGSSEGGGGGVTPPSGGQGGGTPGDPATTGGTGDTGGTGEAGAGGAQGGAPPVGGQGGGTAGDPTTGGTGQDTGTGGGTTGGDGGTTGQGGGEQGGTGEQGGAAQGGGGRATPVDTFPYPITREILERGQERYNIFCAPCHALTGNGDGMIVARGFSPPPSFHTDRLRDAPVGHFYDVITNGYGRMYSYAARVYPTDRWAIVAYIRALQLSQNATIEDVPPEERQGLEGAGGAGE
jgi:hypothetical protein